MISKFKLSVLLLLCILFSTIKQVIAQSEVLPNFDIAVFELKKDGQDYAISDPIIVAASAGYDNQPYFSDDGESLYFTRIENENADLWRWSFKEKSASNLSESDLSEYSPTEIPFEAGSLSTVRVEEDGTQRLWKLSKQKIFSPIFKTIKPVGYHVWRNKNIAMFVLGEPHQLQVTQYGQEKTQVIDENIGRCLQPIPNKNQISYSVDMGKSHLLKRFDFSNNEITSLFLLPEGVQDYVWLNQSTIISSINDSLVYLNAEAEMDKNQPPVWHKIINQSDLKLKQISRLAVSKTGNHIAVVYVAN